MQFLMTEKELADKLSEARVGGYEFGCVVAHSFNPAVAQEMKKQVQDARREDSIERLFGLFDKRRQGNGGIA